MTGTRHDRHLSAQRGAPAALTLALVACGPVVSVCGNGVCQGGESCYSCPGDCGPCVSACGNGRCEPGEGSCTCPADCGVGCGDGCCTGGENCVTCARDCGGCGATAGCGDGVCGDGETCGSCAADCAALCPAPDCAVAADGAVCDDGDAATRDDVCLEGACLGAGTIRLRSRHVARPAGLDPALADPAVRAALPARPHLLLQTYRAVPAGLHRDALEAMGVELLAYLADGGWFAAVPNAAIEAVAASPGVHSLGPIEPDDKLHPALAAGALPGWSRAADGRVGAIVRFFADVDVAAGAAALAGHGVEVGATLDAVRAVKAFFPGAALDALAADDVIQWVEPLAPPPVELNATTRVAHGAAALQAPPVGLDGADTMVLMVETGVPAAHPDLGRVVARDGATRPHATHVAGTILGDGAASMDLDGARYRAHRGVAPGALLLARPLGVASVDCDGDIVGSFLDAFEAGIDDGARVVNNSWGATPAWSGPRPACGAGAPCSFEGDYGTESAAIDVLIRDRFVPFVFAAGNERGGACGDDYRTLPPPAGAKNGLTVGAVETDAAGAYVDVQEASSFGPIDDGRLKPDVVARGADVRSAWVDGGDFAYQAVTGTSMAAPAVTGILALLMEHYAATHPGAVDPLPSTWKALLAHTARDVGTAGPDYRTGYGMVDARRAAGLISHDAWIFANRPPAAGDAAPLTEGWVQPDPNPRDAICPDRAGWRVELPSGMTELRATLAWDDAPGVPNSDDTDLINDLDVRVYEMPDPAEPGTWIVHHPFTLDPARPADAAVDSRRNARDNLEQVRVAAPAAGTWLVEVVGHRLPAGAQEFSLVVTANRADADGDGDELAYGDCAEGDAAIGPSAPEACDGEDDDCDGLVDEQAGCLAWEAAAGGAGADQATAVARAGGGWVVAGTFTPPAVFGDGQAGEVSFLAGAPSMFVARYRGDGTLHWARRTQGLARPERIAVTPDGAIAVVGAIDAAAGAVTFGGGAAAVTAGSDGGQDGFVALLDAAGQPLWLRRLGGATDQTVTDVGFASDGSLRIAGRFDGDATFNAGRADALFEPGGPARCFVARYLDDGGIGQEQGAWQIGRPGADLECRAPRLAVLADDATVVADARTLAWYAPDLLVAAETAVRSDSFDEIADVAAAEDGHVLIAGHGGCFEFGDPAASCRSDGLDVVGTGGYLAKFQLDADGLATPAWAVPLGGLPVAVDGATGGGAVVVGTAGTRVFGFADERTRTVLDFGADGYVARYDAYGRLRGAEGTFQVWRDAVMVDGARLDDDDGVTVVGVAAGDAAIRRHGP